MSSWQSDNPALKLNIQLFISSFKKSENMEEHQLFFEIYMILNFDESFTSARSHK